MDRQERLTRIFQAALARVSPEAAVRRHVSRRGSLLSVGDTQYDLSDFDRIFILGGGKAAAPMAAALEEIIGDRISEGLVIVKYGHTLSEDSPLRLRRTAVREAAHPVPDAAGEAAALELLRLAQSATERDLVLCVISGGASALMPASAAPVTLAEKQQATRLLLECGATINEINALRKHLSGIKGGRLARALAPATVHSLIISDVIGDPLDIIASGPTVPDSSTWQCCLDVIKTRCIADRMPSSVMNCLTLGARGERDSTVKPGDPCFARTRNLLVATGRQAVDGAAEAARALGYTPVILTTRLNGEAREAARFLSAVALEAADPASCPPRRHSGPVCFLAGGETTVTIAGSGKGGRNQEMALAANLALHGQPGSDRIGFLSAGTDGTDGPTDAAGAFALPEVFAKADSLGLDPLAFLRNNDSYGFFERTGHLLKTGPTLTNVMDVQIILVD